MAEQFHAAHRFKELRLERDLTQKELAEALRVGIDTVRNVETGKTQCKTQYLIAFARYFEVPTDYLTGLTETRTRYN